MFLLEKIAKSILNTAKDIIIEDVRIGLRYTGVKLSNGRGGLAYSYIHEMFNEKNEFLPLLLKNVNASLVLEKILTSKNMFSSVIGTALINAFSDLSNVCYETGDIFEYVSLRKNDFVAMVGNIHPLVPKIETLVSKLLIFERMRFPHSKLLPDWIAAKYLADADIVFFTGASIINRTFDQLLPYIKKARDIIVVGPSTPLFPEFYKKLNVSYIAGMLITDADKMLDLISQGAGTRNLSPVTEKVTIKIK